MRRADRLFRIVTLLGGARVMTARQLAELLEVSERTIYRDVADLIGSGTPIDGEAGVGYRLRRDYRLPPLHFSEDELSALAVGLRMVGGWADPALARAAELALARIDAVMPAARRSLRDAPVIVPDFHVSDAMVAPLATLREAMGGACKLRVDYVRADGEASQRVLWPLGLIFWGSSWTLGAWCELRENFRTFRLDRIGRIEILPERFDPSRGRRLQDYIDAVRCDESLA
ncbi:YafY family protein [Denitromonas sp.]|uniref:helix-turn-helix transcriptional regulator n=1 Tax=Denitromonas sp. TaxID=2734609 RepID=UPI002B003666|nr:YafY family protein [Denitromonas sp.]